MQSSADTRPYSPRQTSSQRVPFASSHETPPTTQPDALRGTDRVSACLVYGQIFSLRRRRVPTTQSPFRLDKGGDKSRQLPLPNPSPERGQKGPGEVDPKVRIVQQQEDREDRDSTYGR